MICEFGDVAVVPFPFVERVIVKVRPAVVLSNLSFNDASGNTLLAMITTARRSTWPSDIVITDAAAAGLHADSYIRWKVFTLPNDLIRRIAGALSNRDRAEVTTALRHHLS